MNKSLVAVIALIVVGSVRALADTTLTADAVKWCDWTSPNVGSSTNFYANSGTFTIAKEGNGMFGDGKGELTYTSTNKTPVAEHQFGNAIWGAAGSVSIFDASGLAGKTGIEMLVNVDPSSTSDQLCVKLESTTAGEFFTQTVSVVRGSTECVQLPLSGFKSSKNPTAVLTDSTPLKGTIQISDGWKGYPSPAQATWIVKLSNIYTYGGAAAADPNAIPKL
jgi:hypothetical protein